MSKGLIHEIMRHNEPVFVGGGVEASLAFVFDVGDEAGLAVDVVTDDLTTAIGEVDDVRAFGVVVLALGMRLLC